MIKINLLPWREKTKIAKKRRFIGIGILGMSTILLALFSLHINYDIHLRKQKNVNAYLQSEIDKEQQVASTIAQQKKERLEFEEKLKFILALYANNFRLVKFFNELFALTPSKISIHSIAKLNEKITIAGSVESEAMLSKFMQDLEKSSVFHQPVMTEIRQQKINNKRKNIFQLELKLEE